MLLVEITDRPLWRSGGTVEVCAITLPDEGVGKEASALPDLLHRTS